MNTRREMVAAGFAARDTRGEAGSKDVAPASPTGIDDARRDVGQDIARAFELLGMTPAEATHALGYSHPSFISRMVTGLENPNLAKLNQLPGFRPAYIRALAERAERAGDEIETRTLITIVQKTKRRA